MISALTQVKDIIGIPQDDPTFDSQISALIPIIRDLIVAHTKNDFVDLRTYASGTFTFYGPAKAVNARIVADPAFVWIDEGFYPNNDIRVFNSTYNDGYFEIQGFGGTGNEIILRGNPEILPGVTEYTTYIYRVVFPIPLQLVASEIIADRISRTARGQVAGGKKSEKIGDYSVTYQDPGAETWQKVYKEDLKPYMRMRFHKSRGSGLINVNHRLV